MAHSSRAEINVRADIAQTFRSRAKARGHVGTDLLHAWVMAAVKAIDEGRGHDLPLDVPTVRGSLGGVHRIGLRYTAPEDEVEACEVKLESVGSSLRAVLEAAVEAYDEAAGDLVAMTWVGQPGRSWRTSSAA